MDADSSMMPETDHDQNQNESSLSPAPMEREQLEDQASLSPPGPSGSPPLAAPPVEQQQAAATAPAAQGQPPQTAVVGPRCAPTYSVMDAVIENKEDGPGPRCGHTLTAVAAVGEEGTPGYIGPRLILFGGATALEGNSAVSGTPTSAGSAGISSPR